MAVMDTDGRYPPQPPTFDCWSVGVVAFVANEAEEGIALDPHSVQIIFRPVDDATPEPRRVVINHDHEFYPLDYALYRHGATQPELLCWSAPRAGIHCPYAGGIMAGYDWQTHRFQFVDHAGWFVGYEGTTATMARGYCEEISGQD